MRGFSGQCRATSNPRETTRHRELLKDPGLYEIISKVFLSKRPKAK